MDNLGVPPFLETTRCYQSRMFAAEIPRLVESTDQLSPHLPSTKPAATVAAKALARPTKPKWWSKTK